VIICGDTSTDWAFWPACTASVRQFPFSSLLTMPIVSCGSAIRTVALWFPLGVATALQDVHAPPPLPLWCYSRDWRLG